MSDESARAERMTHILDLFDEICDEVMDDAKTGVEDAVDGLLGMSDEDLRTEILSEMLHCINKELEND
jgi:hypothetical protein